MSPAPVDHDKVMRAWVWRVIAIVLLVELMLGLSAGLRWLRGLA